MTGPTAVLSGIHRAFGPVQALRGADLTLRAGEVHGVVGGNGAGKSTLFNVLAGRLRPDQGTISMRGEAVTISSPRAAWALGIGMVHQHFTLVPTLSVLENLALAEVADGVRLDLTRVRAAAADLFERTGLSVDLDAYVETLDVGDKQRAEILKALLRDPAVLVLDEPTAVLTPQEVDGLFDLLRGIAKNGCAVAIVAHKLDEVMAVSDHVTVLRDGQTVLTGQAEDLDRDGLVRAMIGADRPVGAALRESSAGPPAGDPVVQASRVGVSGTEGRLFDVTLSASRGEIVGVTGIDGNGQHALALLLAGYVRGYTGSLTRPAGVGYIPQDRLEDGVIGGFEIAENIALPRAGASGPMRMPWVEIRADAESVSTRFSVAAPDVHTRAEQLSGGNQQRVIVGREIRLATDLLVAENPTRGLDIAAAAFVHSEIRALVEASNPPAVVLISTDIDEVDALADRLFVMSRGRLIPVPSEKRTREDIGRLMLGVDGD